MIGVCSSCGSLFETTTEDAYTPGTQCPRCYRQSRAAPLDALSGPVLSDPRLRYEVWHVDAGAVAVARAALNAAEAASRG